MCSTFLIIFEHFEVEYLTLFEYLNAEYVLVWHNNIVFG